ncbi:hypothetical protein [Escherichia coli]|uniref:hypothetical protein n=1 Tax=Escherichia coli TaxID=562 RepID=UPI000F08EA2F|nr:hypothetical protein [Escherichia coli]AYQ14587.1 hypothetical protein EB670_24730 [Escherichia coli]
MTNLELYGIQKVQSAYHLRLREIEQLSAPGERNARIMAWNAFVDDQISLDNSNTTTGNIARIKYSELIEMEGNVSITDTDFIRYFFDETYIINKRVTSKKIQFVFYIFLGLAAYGIYSFFS